MAYSIPPTSMPHAAAMRSTSRTICDGGSYPSTRSPLRGASTGQALRTSSAPSVVWHTSAGERVKGSPAEETRNAERKRAPQTPTPGGGAPSGGKKLCHKGGGGRERGRE